MDIIIIEYTISQFIQSHLTCKSTSYSTSCWCSSSSSTTASSETSRSWWSSRSSSTTSSTKTSRSWWSSRSSRSSSRFLIISRTESKSWRWGTDLSIFTRSVPHNLGVDGTTDTICKFSIELGNAYPSYTLASDKSRTAAASTMFLMTNFLMALSLGQHREQLVQRMYRTWPRPLLLRPPFLRFNVMVNVYLNISDYM